MPKTYARFAAVPIGAGLAARDSGLTLVATDVSSYSRLGRSDISFAAGTHGAEFVFWGDDITYASIGVLNAAHGVQSYMGGGVNAIGWRLSNRTVHFNGAVINNAMPAVGRGDIVGVRVAIGTPNTVKFYLNGNEVWSGEVAIAGPLYFGAGLGTLAAGTTFAAVNAGQWGFRSAAAQAGWYLDGGVASARLSDEEFTNAAGDAVPHAQWLGKIADESLQLLAGIDFWAWDGDPTQSAVAQLRIQDADGALDALAMSDVRGVPVAIRQVDQGAAYSTSVAVARFVLDRIVVESDVAKVITLTDAHSDLDEPLARKPFLPNIPTLAWQPQPVVIGAVASVPALPCNSDGTALWLSDAPLAEVSVVMDRGDDMAPADYTVTPDAQQLTMSSPPVGPVVCDVSSIGAAMAPATLQQALAAIFQRIGKSAWSSTDAAAIDAATGYAGIGYYTRDANTTIRQALAAILPSYSAGWWQDADGVIRFTRITAPEAFAGALAFDMSDGLLAGDVVAVPDPAPNLSRRMAYRPNAQRLAASDLVTDMVDVPQSKRDQLTASSRGLVAGNGPLAERYRHADAAIPMMSCLFREQDAQAEIDYDIALYPIPRFFYSVAWRSDDPPPTPGSIGKLTYPRYDLAAGKKLLVKRVIRQPSTGDAQLILWG